jgi:hypothetical protein
MTAKEYRVKTAEWSALNQSMRLESITLPATTLAYISSDGVVVNGKTWQDEDAIRLRDWLTQRFPLGKLKRG